jgi:catechol 2,3-dioxygenase-like lactoylglutathione lyase family enzyme
MKMIAAREAVDAGILVSDIGQSLWFYSDLLELETIEELELPLGRLYRLRFGQSFVKLIVPKKPAQLPVPGIDAQLGIRYITFPVRNLAEIFHHCVAAGVSPELEPTGLIAGALIAMLRDPDGNIVELVQRGE